MGHMSRTFWFAAGAASGVYALVKAKRTAQNFTPDGVAARFAAVRTGARLFAAEVSTGMAVREAQLREQLALPAAEPASAGAAALESHSTTAPTPDHEGSSHGHR
jgi:hypothetical protein